MRGVIGGVLLAVGCQFSGASVGNGSDAAADASIADAPEPTPWSLPDYQKRRRISIDNRTRNEALVGFPVPLRFAVDENMARSELRLRGENDTTDLEFEVESFSDQALVWVRGDLAAGAITNIYLYYDYQGQPTADVANSASTFAGFAGVFHFYDTFNETNDPVDNATGGANLDTVLGLSPSGAASVFGPGLVFDRVGMEFAQTAVNVQAFTARPGQRITYEGWFNTAATGATVVDNFDGGIDQQPGCQGVQAFLNPTGQMAVFFGAGDICDGAGGTDESNILSGSSLNDSEWHHLAIVVDRVEDMMEVYIDGASEGKVGIPPNGETTLALRIGLSFEFGGPFLGTLDEVRVSGFRSSAWIEATFASGDPSGGFVTVGDEESLATAR